MSDAAVEEAPGPPAPASAGTGSRQPHGRLARSAVGMSLVSGAAIAAAVATFGIAYAAGGSSAVEDNWVAYFVASLALAGLVCSLAAFALAVVAKVEQERWAVLWLPLSVFPAAVLFVVLGELFWWE